MCPLANENYSSNPTLPQLVWMWGMGEVREVRGGGAREEWARAA